MSDQQLAVSSQRSAVSSQRSAVRQPHTAHSIQRTLWVAVALATLPVDVAGAQEKRIRVVTTLPTYAAITREIVGDYADVSAIAEGDENPHFVQPRPSFALRLRRADLFITTGLDLELWMPALVDKANNPNIRDGSSGFVTTYPGIELLDIPASVSRAQGDIHLFGNPHIWTHPVNAIIIGRNILTGLKRTSPGNAAYFEQRYAEWREHVLHAYVGSELLELLGSDVIVDLASRGRLWDFISSQEYQGRLLVDRLGGWLQQAAPFRGRRMVCYHKEWDYFSHAFGIPCVEYIEPKPGIPPTPKHVAQVINLMKTEHIPVLFSTNYYDHNHVRSVANRTGATAVIVPSNTGGAHGTDTYTELVSLWIRELLAAFEETSGAP